MVESVLADWYEGTARAAELRQRAEVRAAQLRADAEAAAAEPESAARRALMALVGLGETRDQIAGLTGLTLSEVRAALTTAEREQSAPQIGTEVVEPPREGVTTASPQESSSASAAEPTKVGTPGP